MLKDETLLVDRVNTAKTMNVAQSGIGNIESTPCQEESLPCAIMTGAAYPHLAVMGPTISGTLQSRASSIWCRLGSMMMIALLFYACIVATENTLIMAIFIDRLARVKQYYCMVLGSAIGKSTSSA